MDWLRWTSLGHGAKVSGFLNANWTNPFMKNVFKSLNSSVNGIQRYIYQNQLNYEDNLSNTIPQAAQYGILTAVIMIVFIDKFLLKREHLSEKYKLILAWPSFINLQTFLTVTSLILFLLLSPLILTLLSVFYIYKHIVEIILRIKYGKRFITILDSTDMIWAIEEDNAKSIISVISMVETNQMRPISSFHLLEDLRKIVSFKLLQKNSACPKLLYKRSFELGYHFWMLNESIDVNHYVQPMNIDKDVEMNEVNLQKYVANQANAKLPQNNTASWEILVGDRPLKGTRKFPVLFRIHHSLGDGVALLKLLLSTIGENKSEEPNKINFAKYEPFKECTMYFSDIFNIRQKLSNICKRISCGVRIVSLLYMMPVCLLNQILRPPDHNILHGPNLTGKKIISWLSEENGSDSLLQKIKQLKRKYPGTTFSELFVSALSMSLQKYFNQKRYAFPVPKFVTAVVPARMETTDFSLNPNSLNSPLKLENNFSVAMLTIPLLRSESTTSAAAVLKRLIAVRQEASKLRKSADFMVNFWIIKIGGYFFPEPILKSLLTSEQASLVVSNLPGPSDVTICENYKLHSMAFFVPHRGTTGIGVTILSCNRRIQMGIMADSALINRVEDANEILKNVVTELEALNDFTLKRM